MAGIEYPVKLKFFTDKSSFSNVDKSTGRGGGAGRESRNEKKQTTFLGRMSSNLGLIVTAVVAMLAVLKPLLDIFNAVLGALTALIILPMQGFINDVVSGLERISKFLSGEINVEELFNGFWGKVTEMFLALMQNNPMFLAFELMAEALKAAWNVLVTAGKWIWDNILKPAWEVLKDVGIWIWEEILKPAWEWLSGVGEKIWTEILQPAWDWLSSVGEKIWNEILKPAWDWFSGIGQKIWGILKNAFTSAVSMIKNAIAAVLSRIPGVNLDGGYAFGGVVPKDGVYRMHAGETVSRGNSVGNTTNNMSPTININVSGGVDRRTINEISRQMRLELQTFSKL